MRILFTISLLCSILFLNCVILQDLRSQPRWSRSQNRHLLSSWGHSHQTLHPLLDLYLGTNLDLSTRTHALMGSIVTLVFHIGQFSPIVGGVPTPATIFSLLREDHVNNHISLPPQNMDMRTLCQVEVTPCKSEGIEPSPWSTLCQVKLRSHPHTKLTLHQV